ncbi:MAG: glycosyl hydrolase family 28-related protein, partial [Pseudohongiellaceae bacterium]
SSVGVSAILPAPTASHVLAWNAGGTALENRDTPLSTSIISALNVLFAPTSGVERSLGDYLGDFVNVMDFMTATQRADVRAGTSLVDVTAATQAAITSAISRGKGALWFPAGNYRISSELLLTSPLMLIGASPKHTIIRQVGTAANGVVFDFPTLVQGGGVMNLSIEAGTGWLTGGSQGVGSSATGLVVAKSNGLFLAQNFGVHNFANGIWIFGCYYAQFFNFQVFYCDANGIVVDKSGVTPGAGNFFCDAKVSNFGFTGSGLANGIIIVASGGDFFKSMDVTSFNAGIVLRPTTGYNVLYCFFDSVLADTSVASNWEFDGTDGKVWSIGLNNCWASFATNANGVTVKGAEVDSIRWTGGRIRENGDYGVQLQSGVNIEFVNVEISANSKSAANTFAGVRVEANVSEWAFIGCRIGNVASTLTGQADGIEIAVGTSQNFRIIGNDLRGAGAGKVPIKNGSTVNNWIISDNLPLQTTATNASNRVALSGGSAGTVAAGSTVYVGRAGSYASAAGNPFAIARQGLVTGFYASVTVEPGAGQTFTYTVFKNGVATSMTGQIADTGDFDLVVTTNAFTVVETDLVTLQLVTSAGAGLSIHNFAIYFEP